MERSLFYVSRSLLPVGREDEQTDAIVATARAHNAQVGITGGLIRSAGYFAQLLEGSADAIDELMERIDRDPRHTDVTVLRVTAIDQRRLPDWSMAYAGESSYVAKQIAPLLAMREPTSQARIDRLIGFIVEMADA
jgi:hypothetical protein